MGRGWQEPLTLQGPQGAHMKTLGKHTHLHTRTCRWKAISRRAAGADPEQQDGVAQPCFLSLTRQPQQQRGSEVRGQRVRRSPVDPPSPPTGSRYRGWEEKPRLFESPEFK